MSENVNVKKREIKFVYVDGEKSNFSPVRGRAALQSFAQHWNHLADIRSVFTNFKTFWDLDVSTFNTIWLDNVQDIASVRKVEKIKKENPDVRIIYALDDFIWEGVAGRATRLNECRSVEMLLEMADTIVVNNGTIVEIMKQMGLHWEDKDMLIIPTTVSDELFSTWKVHKKRKIVNKMDIPKPKILIKGVSIPKNVQTFITVNYNAFDITISSVGELSQSVINLLESGKIRHMMHWSNPDVTAKTNISSYARERDMGFDFVFITKPDDLTNDYYELASGDEDVIFAIANGSVPVCGVDHVGYDDESIFYASGLSFGPETTPKQLADMVKENYVVEKWNAAIYECVNYIRPRLASAPETLRMYYSALIGIDEFTQETELIQRQIEKMKAAQEEEAAE